MNVYKFHMSALKDDLSCMYVRTCVWAQNVYTYMKHELFCCEAHFKYKNACHTSGEIFPSALWDPLVPINEIIIGIKFF